MEVNILYESKIKELLDEQDEVLDDTIITLSPDASALLEDFFNQNE